MSTKRYWSAIAPVGYVSKLKKKEREEYYAFDAKLTPDDLRDMQTIDADCNDCRHFKRGAMTKVGGLTSFAGHCLKLDKHTTAWPMQFSGHKCFSHRRSDVDTASA